MATNIGLISRPKDNLASALDANRKRMGAVSENLNKADLVGSGAYARRNLHITDLTLRDARYGATASQYYTSLQEETINSVRGSLSTLEELSVKNDFYARHEALVGDRGMSATFAHSGESMIESLNLVTQIPNGVNRLNFVSSMQTHIRDLKSLYNGVQDMRRDADGNIEKSLQKVNVLLERIAESNQKIGSTHGNFDAQMDWVDNRRAAIQELSTLVGVRVVMKDEQATIYTINDGRALVQGKEFANFAYSRATQVDATTTFSPITVTGIGGLSFDVTNLLSNNGDVGSTQEYGGGKLRGLLDLRDTELVGLFERLDKYSESLRDNFNAIHNTGASPIARSIHTGVSGLPGTGAPIVGSEQIVGQGFLRVAVVDTLTNKTTSEFLDINLSVSISDINDLLNTIRSLPNVNASINAQGQVQILYTGATPNRGISFGTVDGKAAPEIKLAPLFTDPPTAYSPVHFFGLNNIFDTPNYALGTTNINGLTADLEVHADLISSQGNYLAMSKLDSTATYPVGVVAVGSEAVDLANTMIDSYRISSYSFSTTNSSTVNGSMLEYVGRIISDQAKKIADTDSSFKNTQYVHEGLAKIYNEEAGVDRQEEMQELMNVAMSMRVLTAAMSKTMEMQRLIAEKI